MQTQPPSAGQGAPEVWQILTAPNHMTLAEAADELAVALLSWAARHPERGCPATDHEPLRMQVGDFLAMVGCPHIGPGALASVQGEMSRRGLRYYFMNEAGDPTPGGEWVRVWLADHLSLGLPGVTIQLRRTREWFRQRAFDISIRQRIAEAALLRYGDEPADPAKEITLLGALRQLKLEREQLERALAQMTASSVEPD